jgi:lipopolysaccharide transport system permease protein
LFLLPVPIILLTLLSLGLGLWTSALNVRYRDIGIVLPVLVQLWMFVSPIVYPVKLVPEAWRELYALNPIVGIIEAFRSSLFNRPFDWTSIAFSAVITASMLVYSIYAFKRMERHFADQV